MSESVEQIEKTMEMYHTAFVVCLAAACTLLVVAVVLFIAFRIPRVFMNLTGIERKRQIKEITETTGNRNDMRRQPKRSEAKPMRGTSDKKKPPVGRPPVGNIAVGREGVQQSYGVQQPQNVNAGSEATQLLHNAQQPQDADNGGEATQLLRNVNRQYDETVPLAAEAADSTAVLTSNANQPMERAFKVFTVSQHIMMVHTDEVIEV